MVLKVKILFGYQRTVVWATCYQFLGTKINKLSIVRDCQEDRIIVARLAGSVRKVFSVHACSTCPKCEVGRNLKSNISLSRTEQLLIHLTRQGKGIYLTCRVWDHNAGIALVCDQQPRYCFHLVHRSYEQTDSLLLNKCNFLLENHSTGLHGTEFEIRYWYWNLKLLW